MELPVTAREDMNLGAMTHRAHEYGLPLEKYDPNQLIRDVKALLESHGLHPEAEPGTGRVGMAQAGASKLLRALGIAPLGDTRYIDRVNAPDPESR
jgi:hypothetical protein